ncbi:MAG: hypothetical protein J7L22_01395 [Candidatus Marinimicrobia bacterium]|nr:hypothetical protein [Candidatus Neomarinimicrobiota bacterium]RKY56879.1 MAG: hypothetical protein DRP96_10750 [Candidatus Neomarinimicrobiota bacterium]
MQPITINLLGNSNLLKKQKRLKFLLSSAYIFLWFFSAFMIFHIYKTNLFISSIYLKEIQKISTEITSQGPKFERIRYLSHQKTSLEKQYKERNRIINRPEFWSQKMLALASLTPENIRLNKLEVRTRPDKKKNKEYLHLSGTAKVSSLTPDNDLLNQYKKSLENNADFMKNLSEISILETRIERHDSQPVMSFSIGVY